MIVIYLVIICIFAKTPFMINSHSPILVALLLLAIILGCSKIDSAALKESTFVSIVTSSDAINNIFVSIEDVQTIIERRDLNSKSNATHQHEIMPYIRDGKDTLFYIVNYAGRCGWAIYSSDKRVPAILAESETGRFSIDEGSPAISMWLSKLSEDMSRIRNASDEELAFSKEEIELNKAFWSGSQPRIVLPPLDELIGHWEQTTYSETEIFDEVDHMVGKWDQYSPYNSVCPFYINSPNERAVAGCVAIAGSQMLLYLHNKIGRPQNMFSQGSCIGNINNFEKAFSCPTESVWSSMRTEYISDTTSTILPEAIMISYIGSLVNMHYCDDVFGQYSWALPGNLKNNVFEYMGINCSRNVYNDSIVKESLGQQMPVVVSASDLLIPVDFDIHCFVIDGYRMTRTRYSHTYNFVLDVIPPGPYIMPTSYTTYTYSQPEVTSIKINWGWWTQWSSAPINDGWYSLTGGWTVTNGNNTYNYNNNIYMTYGFSANE